MKSGTVKMWNAAKGFGFINSDEDEDIFLHVRDLDVTLKAGQINVGMRVKFDVKREMKGDRAISVRRG
jgi:cold shock protein